MLGKTSIGKNYLQVVKLTDEGNLCKAISNTNPPGKVKYRRGYFPNIFLKER